MYSGFIEALSLCVPSLMMDKISLCNCPRYMVAITTLSM